MESKIKEFIKLEEKKKKLNGELKEISSKAHALKLEIVEYMQNNDMGTTKYYEGFGAIENGAPELQPTYRKENEEEVFNFLTAQGMGSVVKLAVHDKTFKKTIRDLVAEGVDIPDFINVSFYSPKLKIKK